MPRGNRACISRAWCASIRRRAGSYKASSGCCGSSRTSSSDCSWAAFRLPHDRPCCLGYIRFFGSSGEVASTNRFPRCAQRTFHPRHLRPTSLSNVSSGRPLLPTSRRQYCRIVRDLLRQHRIFYLGRRGNHTGL